MARSNFHQLWDAAGDFHRTALEAIEAWENIVGYFGVKL